MNKNNITKLDELARIRLSKHFFLRDFLFSETAATHRLNNIPDDVELAVAAGSQLCQRVLEPIQNVWGRIHIRSAYRSPAVNQLGNELGANCATNERNYAGHIWDKRDEKGFMGATVCIVIPGYLDYYQKTGDWTSLAWWIHAHIPEHSGMWFFPKLCAFNIGWYEDRQRPKSIKTYVKDPKTDHNKFILSKGVESDYYRIIPLAERYVECERLIKSMDCQ